VSGPVVLGVADGLVRMRVADAAAAFAARVGRPLRVVHVHHGPHESWEGDAGVRTESYLARTAAGVAVERWCTVGDPAGELLAATPPDGIVVLGDRHLRLGAGAGGTTLDVVARTGCPILVVPEYRVPAGGVARRGGVVAGLDGGATDRAVLAAAADAAGAGPVGLEVLDTAPERAESVQELLTAIPAPPTVVAAWATAGPVDDALAIAARGADLAVLGLPDAGRADAAALGLLSHAPCPVLIVPAEGEGEAHLATTRRDPARGHAVLPVGEQSS